MTPPQRLNRDPATSPQTAAARPSLLPRAPASTRRAVLLLRRLQRGPLLPARLCPPRDASPQTAARRPSLLPATPASARRVILLRRLQRGPLSHRARLCPPRGILLRRLRGGPPLPRPWERRGHASLRSERRRTHTRQPGTRLARPPRTPASPSAPPRWAEAPGRLTCSLLPPEVDGQEASEPSPGP